jgi:alanyl-tRNA synthetase
VTRTAAQIRQEFIDFFCRKHGHAFVPSSPVVPLDDPTLLFTNAGMNQFKPYFLGLQTPKHPRVANTQKCIRAGGKHNDLDDVGHDTYHHTFFEMLGNWSFGDYFKKEAIAWAWELLVDVWGIDPTRLHATYFGGDASECLEPDLEARDLWLGILPPERVHAGSKKDNFWEMGETGPCGPCSEIHIDLTPDKSGAKLVNAGDARVIEIWNLVFIQFNRDATCKLTPLPARHVDTGMGFERVTAVLQGHNNNYATDVFVPIIQAIERISRHTYGESHEATGPRSHEATEPRSHEGDVAGGLLPGRSEPGAPATGQSPSLVGRGKGEGAVPSPGDVGILPANRYARFIPGDMRDEACRVIADHIRCLTFAITDGAIPDKEGRGYVLRRILRRAVRFGWQYLGLHEPFLCRLVDTVVEVMGDAFPELKKNPQHVKDVIREEEESFDRTLDRGIALFEEAADFAIKRHHGEIQGEDAFKLHDTYGFPIDLTEVMAKERGLCVDIGEYERLMEEARARARACAKGFEAAGVAVPAELLAPFGPTDDSPKYTTEQLSAPVRAIIRCGAEGQPELLDRHACVRAGEAAGLVFGRTCFYAEAGGQVGDNGTISGPALRFDIESTQQIGDVVVHFGTLVMGEIRVGDTLELRVDVCRRATMKNHTATHVMNWALRDVLGDHVQQKGSLVDHEKTRFDFSHPKALTPEQVEHVEQLVNDRIRQSLPVHYRVVPQQDALKINGLRAVFGERYPDEVRVMSVGVPVEELVKNPGNPEWRKYSIEFCGGTHLNNTRDIEHFTITTEEAVAKGVRRVVAVTGETAKLVEEIGSALVQRAEQLTHGSADAVAAGLAELQNTLATATIPLRHRHRLRELMSELQAIVKQQHKSEAADAAEVVKAAAAELLKRAETIGDTLVVVGEMPAVPLEQLKMGADWIKQKSGSAAVLLGVRVLPESEPGAPATGPDVAAGASPADPNRDREGAAKSGGKVLLLAAMTPDLIQRGLKAGDLVKAVAPIVGGGGGGPPTMAQAGGKQPERLAEALDTGRKWIAERLA